MTFQALRKTFTIIRYFTTCMHEYDYKYKCENEYHTFLSILMENQFEFRFSVSFHLRQKKILKIDYYTVFNNKNNKIQPFVYKQE